MSMFIFAPAFILTLRDNAAAVIGFLVGAVTVGWVAWVMMRQINRVLRILRRHVDRLGSGDLRQRLAVPGPPELVDLTEALNSMALQLADRLSTAIRQRNELGAVVGSMVEGVLALDNDLHVLNLNPAACQMLSLNPASTIGHSVYEVVRNADLHDVIRQAMKQDGVAYGEMTLAQPMVTDSSRAQETRTLQLQSAPLYDEQDRRIGIVLVLHDVTQLRRLESVRRDFVSNVSHEVKTPVSAIKAAVETLREMADDQDTDRQRFLEIIARQADRLAAIVDDLLSLARIEQGDQAEWQNVQPTPVWPAVHAAIETCQAAADSKQITLDVACDRQVHARANEQLLTQAIVNLIDNAIKYSEPGTRVDITCRTMGGEAVIGVKDQGRGIEASHLPRIFERFYREDKARSRDLGGTGLGLSIVKHIAEAHGGRVSVESQPGVGSHFKIHLPVH